MDSVVRSAVPSNPVSAVLGNNSAETNVARQVISVNYNGSASIKLDHVKPLLQLVRDIVKDNPEAKSTQTTSKSDINELQQKASTMIPDLSQLVHKITCELSCDCPEKGSAHERANSLLALLSNYSPDAKVVLVLMAFAIRYGDFMVKLNQYRNKSNKLIDRLLSLKEVTGTFKSEDTLISQMTNIKDIILTILDVLDCFIELKDFRSWKKIPSKINIDEIISLMIITVIHCGFTVSDLRSGLNDESELTDATEKIKYYRNVLTSRRTYHRNHQEEIQATKDYHKLSFLLQFPQTSNVDILHYFISSSNDSNILYNHKTKDSATLSVFHDKKVLIFYSSFEPKTFQEDLSYLTKIYPKTIARSEYKFVWVPIAVQKTSDVAVQKTIIDEERYNAIISKFHMSWYTLTYEAVSQVNRGLVHLLQKDWGFTGKPMLVVLDERGEVVHKNALSMLHFYGEEAFPFTPQKENQLLTKNYKGMQLLLLKQFDKKVSQWINSKGQYVCLCGGDINECNKITELLARVTNEANIKVETAYVGRSTHHKETGEATLEASGDTKLGHIFEYESSTQFWQCLQQYMLHLGTNNFGYVPEGSLLWVPSLLTFDKSRDSWVAIGNADQILVFGGSVFTNGLKEVVTSQLKQWKSEVTTDNFLQVLSERLKDHKNKQEKHCHELEIVGNPAPINGAMCPTCNELMQVVMLYRCCK